jgi:hypothetical protein
MPGPSDHDLKIGVIGKSKHGISTYSYNELNYYNKQKLREGILTF